MSRADILERHEKGLYPYNPARAIARAYLNGLPALKDLLYRRIIKSINHVYISTQNKWAAALDKWRQSKRHGTLDFSPITEVERHMRRNFNKMIWETTARYGNTEYKRIQNERKGKVGPLNRLLNMAGAQLRNFAVIRYPFPEPETIGRRGRRPIAGFEGDNDYPWVEVAHITLPELDFADMIRSHVFELCRKCFISDVPVNDARRYVNLLIRRLAPFLDYLYTSGETGRWGFRRSKKKKGRDPAQPDAEQILREIVDEIETFYGTRNGKPLTVTQVLSEPEEETEISFFLDQVRRLKYPKETVSTIEQQRRDTWADFLKDLCERNILLDADAHYMQKETKKRVRWYGIKWHRLLTNGLVQPYNLRTIVLEGDRWAKDSDEYLIAAEIPITTPVGKGRADIVIFKRFVIPNPRIPRDLVVWKPVAVFDIKSKTAFNWEIKAEEKESKKYGKKVVPKFVIRRRGLSDTEWDEAIVSTPDKYGKDQLKAYAKGLVQEYVQITGDRNIPTPVSGTVIVDVSQDSAVVRTRFLQLLHGFCAKAPIIFKKKLNQRLQIKLKRYDWLKLVLVVDSINEEQVDLLLDKGNPVIEPEPYNPLIDCENEDSKFILYLSAASASRSGPTAAWIARYWHGLEYLYGLSKLMNDAEVVWFDISGDFSYQRLAETRLRLNQHKIHIQNFYRKIRIKDVSKMVYNYLYRNGDFPGFSSLLDEKNTKRRIIVLSGWDILDDSTPRRLWSAISELKHKVSIEFRNTGHTIVWFTKPRTAEDTSSLFQRRSFDAFYTSSSLRYYVTKIIWNLPVKPYASSQHTPLLDELRVIVKQTTNEIYFDLVDVPVLHGWSPKFWNQSTKRRPTRTSSGIGRESITANDVLNDRSLCDSLIQESLDLIPWIRSLWPKAVIKRDFAKRRQRIAITSVKHKDSQKKNSIPWIVYRAVLSSAKSGASYVPSISVIPRKKLTFYRRYRSDGVKEDVLNQNHRPPPEQTLIAQGFDIHKVSKIELKRLRQAIKITTQLRKTMQSEGIETEWHQFLSGLDNIISHQQIGIENYTLLGDVVSYLQTNPLSMYLWKEFYWSRRAWMLNGLNQEAKTSVRNLMFSWSAPHLKFGNYLFLLILALKLKFGSLDIIQLRQLFRSLWPWQLLQLGLRPKPDTTLVGASTFDIREVWTELVKRAKLLSVFHLKEPLEYHFGQIITPEDREAAPYYWLLVQDSKYRDRLLSGMWSKIDPFIPSETIHWTESNLDVISESMSILKESQEIRDSVITKEEGREYLWYYEDQTWVLLGEIQIIRHHKDALLGIHGFRVIPNQLSYGLKSSSEEVMIPNQLRALIQKELEDYSKLLSKCSAVICQIWLESGEYVVKIRNPAKQYEFYEERRFHKTSELLNFLRTPIATGVPIQSQKNPMVYYTWNPYEDIEYFDMKIIRPYVERNTPFIHTYSPAPLNAEEVNNRKRKRLDLTVTHDPQLCPLVQGTGKQHGPCWRIEFSDDEKNPYLKSINKTPFNEDELVLLLKSGGVFLESAYYEFSYRFEPDPESIYGIEFRESRQIAKLLGINWIKPGSFLHIDSEADL